MKQVWLYYRYCCEELVQELPEEMLMTIGQAMTMRVYVDSDHVGDVLTC